MNNLQVGARGRSLSVDCDWQPLLAIRCRVARWVTNWQRHAQDEHVRRELDRLREFHLDDIGVTRSPRRAIKLDMGRGVPPAVILELEYRQRAEPEKSQDIESP